LQFKCHIFFFKLIKILGLSEHDAHLMANTNENNMDNVTQIVLPNVQDKMKKDIPQVN